MAHCTEVKMVNNCGETDNNKALIHACVGFSY